MDDNQQWPSAGWQRAFAEAATPETMQVALRCAAIELERLRRFGVAVADDAEDLVQRVILATSSGSLLWRPGVVALRLHLRDGIRDLGRRLRMQAARAMSTISLDAADEEHPVWTEAALLSDDGERDLTIRKLATRLEHELWVLAAGDQQLLRVLKVMSGGEDSPAAIAEATGLPLRAVERARRQLRRLGRQLDHELVHDIHEALDVVARADEPAVT